LRPSKAFTVYNAAAGAGKTYTLVKEYLIRLFTPPQSDGYKMILAVTFTNKAVAEMKSRIIVYLRALSQEPVPLKYQPMLQELIMATSSDESLLRKKAKKILKSIVHNYAGFDVVTIDTFTHRLIRTFANDLDIPMNFEVAMDIDTLLQETVDRLIAKVGKDQNLTDLLLSFALSKLDNDKSWDISIELYQVAKILLDENQRNHLNSIKDKTETDFKAYKKVVQQHLEQTKAMLLTQTHEFQELLTQNELLPEDFSGKYIPNHFRALQQGKAVSFDAKWKQDIENASFYTKTLALDKKEAIDRIRPQIEWKFHETKALFFNVHLLENIQKNAIPLSVLNAIHKELELLKKERNILLIAEFNGIISNAIAGQPAPFIYERIGERYRNYFIDEFQDTSILQWNNMIPLIDNALASETLDGQQGSLTLVGDAKQAIYRWRGGKAEQFMELADAVNPFSVSEKTIFELPKNYRSYSEIINFNNAFFTHLAQDFSSEMHQKLYTQGNKQEINSNVGGCVKLSFIAAENVAEEHEIYPVKIHESILELQQQGYELKDICILTRKLHQGVVIANYLATKGIPIISSETLLLANAPEISCIISLLELYIQPNNKVARVQLLHFLTNQLGLVAHHLFIEKSLELSIDQLENELASHKIIFRFEQLHVLPLYESVAYIIQAFQLHEQGSAYLQFFLDAVFDFGQKNVTGISGFLDYWALKKQKLSIVVPEGKAAVQIMTIHKSKGLEFPVVLYPYANEDIYQQRDTKIWYPLSANKFAGFEHAYINYSPTISQYSTIGDQLVKRHQSEQELDAINLLYVALTRAVEQLHIFTKKELNAKGTPNPKKYSGKFIRYLQHCAQWDTTIMEYTFGNPDRPISPKKETSPVQTKTLKHLHCTPKEMHQIHVVTNANKLWDMAQDEAVEHGILLHDLMAQIITPADIARILRHALQTGAITTLQQKELSITLEKIVTHPELTAFYSPEKKILNERDIICNGTVYRPDRLVIEGSDVTIIDYKTGSYNNDHHQQVFHYATLLAALGYAVKKRLLVYIYPSIQVRSI